MRTPSVSPLRLARWALAVVALIAAGTAACVIGPKQDDPAEDRALPGQDAGFYADSGSLGPDGSVAVTDDAASTGGSETSSPAADTASSDAPADGSDGSADSASDATCGDGSTEAGDACPTGGADAISGD